VITPIGSEEASCRAPMKGSSRTSPTLDGERKSAPSLANQ
jgi:hypothetical protein